MITVRLINNTKRPAHKDILVDWGELHLKCIADSYFLVLHEGSIPERGVFQKASTVMQIILLEWKSVTQKIQEGGTVYLPFDFSDEYIGFIKATLSNHRLSICHGATRKLFGWNIDPLKSVPLPMNREDESFINDEILIISVENFLEQIEKNIQIIGENFC